MAGPVHSPTGHVPGFKLCVGDLPQEWTTRVVRRRLMDFEGVVDGVVVRRTEALNNSPCAIITFESAAACTFCSDTVQRWHWQEERAQGQGIVWRWPSVRYVHIPR